LAYPNFNFYRSFYEKFAPQDEKIAHDDENIGSGTEAINDEHSSIEEYPMARRSSGPYDESVLDPNTMPKGIFMRLGKQAWPASFDYANLMPNVINHTLKIKRDRLSNVRLKRQMLSNVRLRRQMLSNVRL
jgi:hypothetical protein